MQGRRDGRKERGTGRGTPHRLARVIAKGSQAVAAALTAMADERAGEPSRKARGIRLVHDDSDGEMMATDADDVEEPAPAAADVEQPVPATPAGLFSDVFGNPDAGWGC